MTTKTVRVVRRKKGTNAPVVIPTKVVQEPPVSESIHQAGLAIKAIREALREVGKFARYLSCHFR